ADNPCAVAIAHNIVRMGAVIAHARSEILAQSPLHRHGPDVGFRRLQEGIDAANCKAGTNHSALCVEPTLKCREREAKRRLAAGSEDKDGCLRSGCSAPYKIRIDQSRRASTELFLYVRLSEPVVVDAQSAPTRPVAIDRRIPCETPPRAEQIVD